MPDWERFPTDEVSLTMLESACNINPDSGHTELQRFLDMTGGDITGVTLDGVEEVFPDVASALEAWGFDDPPILTVERDKPPHSEHTVIVSLIEEIRRGRAWSDHYKAEAERYRDKWDECLIKWGKVVVRGRHVRAASNTGKELDDA